MGCLGCGFSLAMALALERIGWSNADYRMRLQANHDLAREHCEQAARPGDGSRIEVEAVGSKMLLPQFEIAFWHPIRPHGDETLEHIIERN